MPGTTDAFLTTLVQARLLDSARTNEIRQWAVEQSADPSATARELMNRGWLTPYQVREVAQGRAEELTIGPYLILDLLGVGGMGRVFRARHTRLERDVALKVIRKEKLSQPQTIGRFLQEIHAAAQVSHPNVVLAFDAESADDNLFLSMEYVEGIDLTKLVLKHGPMPVPSACDVIRQAALGLEHAFERGLVHRDIKPSNLLYTPKGQVKILDLGLAQLSRELPGGENAGRVTQQGFVLGTPDFLAPEQAQNPAGVDIRADIYALGATLFFLLTGRAPFEGSTPTEKLLKHINDPPPSVLPFRPDVPPQLDALIRTMMAKQPAHRPATPAQVAAALAPFVPPPSVPVVSTVPTAPRSENPFEQLAPSSHPNRPIVARNSRSVSRGQRFPRSVILLGLGLVVTALATLSLVAVFYLLGHRLVFDSSDAPLDGEFTNSVGQLMLKLEPGSFLMGSPDSEEGRDRNEGPQRWVRLSSPFYLSATEVTRAEYLAVMGNSPRRHPNLSDKFLHRAPATGVTWDDAIQYCRELNHREPNRRKGWEYRLPTEAEWEYAARAGTETPFPSGNQLTQYTDGIFQLVRGDRYGQPHPEPKTEKYPFAERPAPVNPKVGDNDYSYRREKNPWGLYDLNGNVWEWCQDRYARYPEGEVTDPTGPAEGVWRVLRGGAFDTPAADCRAARRVGKDPSASESNIGFRVVFAPKK